MESQHELLFMAESSMSKCPRSWDSGIFAGCDCFVLVVGKLLVVLRSLKQFSPMMVPYGTPRALPRTFDVTPTYPPFNVSYGPPACQNLASTPLRHRLYFMNSGPHLLCLRAASHSINQSRTVDNLGSAWLSRAVKTDKSYH